MIPFLLGAFKRIGFGIEHWNEISSWIIIITIVVIIAATWGLAGTGSAGAAQA